MIKKILAILLAVLFVFSFAACGKDDKDDNNSSQNSSVTDNDPTQDYDDDIWHKNEITEDQKQEVEDLWDELKDKDSAEITDTDDTSSNSSSNNPSTSTPSSSSNTGSSGNDSTSDKDEDSKSSQTTITDKVDAIY